MLAIYQREKLINAVLYFATKTRFCGKTKLFKLLYFLDFEHFKKTGRSVTGLRYCAWGKGPVPVSLYEEMEWPKTDMSAKVAFEYKAIGKNRHYINVKPKTQFDPSHFTKRELKLMERLAKEYATAKSEDMVEATHIETLPWHRVYVEEGRKQAEIPYVYALRDDEKDIMDFITKENDEIVSNYS